MSEQNAIELRAVKKIFDQVVAVQDFSVTIAKGEFFSLLGPSGCGKTTTLRMIAGLEAPTEGEILLEDEQVNNRPAYKRHVNTVFQDYALFPHMTVKKNIYFPLKMKKVSPRDAKPRIQRALRLVNMEGFENRLPQQLSGGQRQRIALARSLVNEPAALLLDEPLGALDFKLRVAMQRVLKDIQRNVGITFVYVTHDQTEAMTMSDRIAVMKDGFVHQIGPPGEIYNTPATAFVASFIGDMNFVHGLLKSGGGAGAGATADLSGVTIKTDKVLDLKSQAEVLICVRTERIHINPERYLANTVQAELRRVVYRGTDYEATCQVGEAELRTVVSAVGWDPSLKVGDRVTLGWKESDSILFPLSEEKDIIKYSVEAV